MALFGTDGIRDIAGRGALDPGRVRVLGRAIGRLVRRTSDLFRHRVPARRLPPASFGSIHVPGQVVIGRDTRRSGPEIESLLVEGLRAEGVSVLRAGVVPTPGVALLTRAWRAALGIMVSASHNPPEFNGIKLFSPEGFKVPDAAENRIERAVQRWAATSSGAVRGGEDRVEREAAREYIEFVADRASSLRSLKVVVDCAHGAGFRVAPEVLRRLGARAIAISVLPTGRNINVACGATAPLKMARRVTREHAHLGVAFDGDQDRALFVDETGALVDGDQVLAMCAADFQERGKLKGRRVVGTVMSNWGLEEFLLDRGLRLSRARVGDRFVADRMLRDGANLGGEPSGHTIFFDRLVTGDGLLTAIQVMSLMAESGRPLSNLAACMQRYPQVLLSIPVKDKPPLERVPGVRRAIGRVERILGKRGRMLVRYSGTEPVCRVMIEGDDERSIHRLADEIASAVKREIGARRPA